MKKTWIGITCALVVTIGLGMFLGKGLSQPGEAQAQESADGRPLRIITTLFPGYDFARTLLGDKGNVTLLLPPGAESHTFEPTPQDILDISKADLFVYAGGESEHWVREMLSSLGESVPQTFAMMDFVALEAEEYTASMQKEQEDEDHVQQEDGVSLDEHVWTSPKNAIQLVKSLSGVLQGLLPLEGDRKAVLENEAMYVAKLTDLDAAFQRVVDQGAKRTLIFGDRFPFRYLMDAYHLSYDAAFPGCSEDSEPSAQTLASLIGRIKSENIPVVFYIEFSSRKTAEILAEETGAKPLLLHSCHNVSQHEMDAGATYLSLMEGNVAALREALKP
ncbi:MAG: zinc ABC transporter substrate-binding protein [Clostridiales bacterium]|nr:zinc ABC transporter substrate-binding protein [Clostridiales bacterium]